ncbi:unnamed protein product, partial [Amoebophrya sp. A25]
LHQLPSVVIVALLVHLLKASGNPSPEASWDHAVREKTDYSTSSSWAKHLYLTYPPNLTYRAIIRHTEYLDNRTTLQLLQVAIAGRVTKRHINIIHK